MAIEGFKEKRLILVTDVHIAKKAVKQYNKLINENAWQTMQVRKGETKWKISIAS